MIYKYTVPVIPPSNNEFIGRNNRYNYNAIKKQWQLLIKAICKPLPPNPISKSIVTLVYYFKNRIRRDPDNYSGKLVLDGLVRAGILADDSFDCIELRLKALYSKENPHLEIYIQEVMANDKSVE